jgi:hypothetical protein
MAENKKAARSYLVPFLAQMQRDMRAYQSLLAPSEQFQKALKESIQPLLDARAKLAESVKPAIDMRQRVLDIHKSFTKEISSAALQALKFQKTLNSFISPSFVRFSEALKKIPTKTRKALVTLGSHGWYLDLEMPMPGLWELEAALNSGNVEEAEKALIEYYRKRTPEIEKGLRTQFPHRARILASAFKAHSRSEYELSIPVFLAQADGICCEMIGMQLFQKRNKLPVTVTYVQTLATDTFQAALLHPLSVALPISASKYERDDTFVGLNRHQVLHGESLSYGSEANSLKAISLLNYVSHVLNKPENRHKKQE